MHHFSLLLHDNLVTRSHQDSGEAERCILWPEGRWCAKAGFKEWRMAVGGRAAVHATTAVGKGGGAQWQRGRQESDPMRPCSEQRRPH